MLSPWLAVLVPAALLGGTAGFVLRLWLLVIVVQGQSMSPCLEPGQRLLARRTRHAARGQIVVVRQPRHLDGVWTWPAESRHRSNRGPWMVKRVVAIAGDRMPRPVANHLCAQVVPADTLVVLGDNDDASTDSRDFGPVPHGQVLAVVTRRLRPPGRRSAQTSPEADTAPDADKPSAYSFATSDCTYSVDPAVIRTMTIHAVHRRT